MQQPTAKARSTTRNRIDDWTDSCGSVTIPAIAIRSITDLTEEPDADHLKLAQNGAQAHALLPYLRDKREKCEAGGHAQTYYDQATNTSLCACGIHQHTGVPKGKTEGPWKPLLGARSDRTVPPANDSVYIVTLGRKGEVARMLASPIAYNRFEDAMDQGGKSVIRNDVWSEFIPERSGVVREWRTPDGRAVWIEQLITVDRYEHAASDDCGGQDGSAQTGV